MAGDPAGEPGAGGRPGRDPDQAHGQERGRGEDDQPRPVQPAEPGERDVVEVARTLLGKPTACVGRDRELKTLAATLDDADAGRGQAWFVVGESGIGKTRLVSALGELAANRGFAVAVGRAK